MSDEFRIPEIGRRPAELDVGLSRKPIMGGLGHTSFKDVLAGAVGEVQRLQNDADTTIRKLVSGEIKDVTQAMVAVEKADVGFQTMMAVRNKMLQAYEEVMRMQV